MLVTKGQGNDTIEQIACSPDGKTLLTASYREVYCLWEIATGKCTRRVEIPMPFPGMLALAFAADNTPFIAFTAVDGIRLFNVLTDDNKLVVQGKFDSFPTFSPDAGMVAMTAKDSVYTYNRITGVRRTIATKWSRWAPRVCFSHLNDKMAIREDLTAILICDLNDAKSPLQPIPVDGGRGFVQLAFSSDDTVLVLRTLDGEVICHHIEKQTTLYAIRTPPLNNSLALSADGRYLLTATQQTMIRVRDAKTGRVEEEYRYPGTATSQIFSADSRKVFVGDNKGSIFCHEIDDFDPDVEFADIKSAAKKT